MWTAETSCQELGERDISEPGAGGGVDEWCRLGQAALQIAPAAHHDLELVEDAAGVVPGEGDHPGAEVAHGSNLETVFLDAAIPGDDEPAATGDLRDPLMVFDRRAGDGAWRPVTFVDDGPWVAGVGDVRAQLAEHTREPKQVGVDVESDLGGSGSAHAARWEFS